MVSVSDLFLLNPKSELEDNMKVGFIPMALVEDGFSGNHFYEERTWKDVKRGYCHFQNGDIGIAKISPCFENRKSTIFKNLPNTYGAGTTELVILRPIKVYTKFYLYLFKSDWYVKEGTKYFKGVVGQQRVHKEIFTDLHIPLPPFAEQQRIVEEIEYWFALIDQIEQDKSDLQTAIRQTKSKILDLAIHGKLVPQDPNDEPASELLKRINPKAEITCDKGHSKKLPQNWSISTVGNVLQLKSGENIKVRQLPMGGKYPIYGGNGINGFYNKCNVSESTIIIGRVGFYCGSVFLTESKAWVTDNALIVSGYEGIYNTIYLAYLLQYLNLGKVSNSTAQPVISRKGINPIPILIPPLSEQQRIVTKIEKLFSVLDNIQNALEA